MSCSSATIAADRHRGLEPNARKSGPRTRNTSSAISACSVTSPPQSALTACGLICAVRPRRRATARRRRPRRGGQRRSSRTGSRRPPGRGDLAPASSAACRTSLSCELGRHPDAVAAGGLDAEVEAAEHDEQDADQHDDAGHLNRRAVDDVEAGLAVVEPVRQRAAGRRRSDCRRSSPRGQPGVGQGLVAGVSTAASASTAPSYQVSSAVPDDVGRAVCPRRAGHRLLPFMLLHRRRPGHGSLARCARPAAVVDPARGRTAVGLPKHSRAGAAPPADGSRGRRRPGRARWTGPG